MQETQNKNYKSILKGSAIFGGTQIFTILVNLFRAKAIAVFLGPSGMGISALLTSAANTIQQFSSLGINLTAVKDVAQLSEISDKNEIINRLSYIRLLCFCLATFGTIICLLFAVQLSKLTFGNQNYTYHFRFLSIFIFFTISSAGELSILQGNKKLKKIAVGSIVSAGSGLIVGVPLYYFMRTEGIVPGMISLSLSSYLTFFYHNRDNFYFKKIFFPENFHLFWSSSKRLIGLGVILMISTLIGTLVTYLLNIFITDNGGVGDVGFFQAANSLTNQYIGLVFTAMAIDYFPRLAAVSHEKEKINEVVNSQLEIVLLLVAPLVTTFMLFSPLIIKILLTEKFLLILPLLNAMALGAFFKAASYPLGYISFAKGDQKVFFWLEGILGNLLQISLNILFYCFFGLVGLGFSFIAIYVLYLLIIGAVTKKVYHFSFNEISIKLIILLGGGCIFVYLINTLVENLVAKYIVGASATIFLIYFCTVEINKRVNFSEYLRTKLKKK